MCIWVGFIIYVTFLCNYKIIFLHLQQAEKGNFSPNGLNPLILIGLQYGNMWIFVYSAY